jgi:hypothetical protein
MASALVQPCPKACPAICAELAKVQRLQTEAQMATEVYNDSGNRTVPGYTEVTDEDELAKLNLDKEDLTPKDSQFRAAVFKDSQGNYTIAFKGTTMTSVADWQANAGQGSVGYSSYYSQAKSIGRDAAAAVGKDGVKSVKFVGHSLGGGLASAAAHSTGLPASTFNAAGLHVFNRSWFNAPPIDAVRVNGEILTGVQNQMKYVPILAPEAAGTPYAIDPAPGTASSFTRAQLNWVDALIPARAAYKYAKAALLRAVDLHGMASVNPALEAKHGQLQRKATEQGCKC